MKVLLQLLFFAALAAAGAPRPVPEESRLAELLERYVASIRPRQDATLVIDSRVDANQECRAYWIEAKALVQFPAEFTEEALKHPALVIRQIRFPEDVCPTGSAQIETSTYLVTESWFKDRVFETVLVGRVHVFKGRNQNDNRNSGTAPRRD